VNEEHGRLANAEKLLSTVQTALQVLSDSEEESLSHNLGQQYHAIEQLSQLDPSLKSASESLNTALIHTEEAISTLRAYADGLDMDPARLQYLEERMSQIHGLSRKHQMQPEELLELQQRIIQELEQLENADATLAGLQTQLELAQVDYQNSATQLHQLRESTASNLSALVSDAMQGLGMDGGRFEIEIQQDNELFHSHGQDKIEFMVSANPGQPLKTLSKVASGGELSRISLAIQMITASCEKVPTLIFDEVDTGIGGGVAEVVGKHLRSLGGERQVMCVTHLPQVAAQAHQHLKVAKQKGHDITTTSIQALSSKDRVDEIARMLGGIEMTKQTIKHAKEMIQRAAG
jgi:DNA repair protein RecN (Recombination protein N)